MLTFLGAHCYNSDCDKCSSGYNLKIEGSTRTCIKYEDLLAYKPPHGIVTGTNNIEACSVSSCLVCRKDNSNCECMDSPTTYFYDDDQGQFQCLPSGPTPSLVGYGPNTADSQDRLLKKCAVPGCRLCYSDYGSCLGCDQAAGFYYQDSYPVTLCYQKVDIPSGWGIYKGLTTSNQLVQCEDSKCSKCKENHQKCMECKNYQDGPEGGKTCYDSVPDGKGVSLTIPSGAKEIQSCSDPECELCPADNKKCQRCGNYFKKESVEASHDCYPDTSKIPDGWGLKGAEKEFKKCQGCQTCSLDYTKCQSCSDGLYLNNQSCVNCDQPGEWREELRKECLKCHEQCKKN